MNNLKRPLALVVAVVLTTAVLAALWPGGLFGSKPAVVLASELSIEATKADNAGVDLDTDFRVSSDSPINPGFIEKHLKVEPALDFTVKTEKRGEVMVIPQKPLEPHKLYKFSIAPEGQPPMRWAFQTKGEFKVVSTLPRDKSSGVPLDTGIEITFSHMDFNGFPDYFTIEPKVEGRFEYHKKTAVFVPRQLDPSTIYTVTVKKGLPLADSDMILEEDYVFQFETQELSRSHSGLHFHKETLEFTTDEKPLFSANYYGWAPEGLPNEGSFVLYRYSGAKNYIEALEARQKIPYWAYQSRENYREVPSSLERVSEFTLPIKQYDTLRFFEFPEALPPGYYLADASIGDEHRQFWFQVTDLGLYAAVAENKALIWVNDLKSGSPVARADVKIFPEATGTKTDESGLALLSTPELKTHGIYAIITHGNREAVAAVLPWSYGDEEWKELLRLRESFWKYLYLDRSLYKSEDTLHFWGIVKPRDGSLGDIGQVKIELSSGEWRRDGIIDTKLVELEDFTFTGSIKLPKLTPGYYNVKLLIDDKVLTSRGFEVKTYSKPSYQLDVKPQQKAVFVGDTVKFDIKSTFFEGTPAANMTLKYHIDGQGTIATDALGEATLSYTPTYDAEEGRWSPLRHKTLFLTANLPESGEIYQEASVVVLNNDISADATATVKGDVATVETTWSKLTVDKVNSGKVERWDQDAYREGPVPHRPVGVKIFREVWDKVEAGQYYDFINKRVETRYYYDYRKVLEAEDEFITDGNGKGSYSFPVDEDASYIAEFTCMDYRGNPAIREVWVSGSRFYLEYDYSWYHLDNAKSSGSYSAGEDVILTMKNNESPLPSRPRGFMFFTARQGIMEARVQDSPEFRTVFHESFVPNFWAKGVYFDGRYYQESYERLIGFEEQEKVLQLSITTDKAEYRPKDTVHVRVEVLDKDGKPMVAKVNLNLVDEALFALSDQYVNLLSSLYSDTLRSGVIGTLKTHEAACNLDGGAEHGGEGGSERQDFRDAVFFKTLTTDENGIATASFQVPDNLTSWRVTGQAVTEDLSAATATSAVVVKLPFFVDMVLNETYLTGDVVEVPLRSFGEKLKSGEVVEYEAVLKIGGRNVFNKVLTGKAFTPVGLALPPLEEGDYRLTVTGKSHSGLADTLTLSFKVVNSLMTQEQVDFYLLEEKLSIKRASEGLMRITFSDYQRSQYLDMLWRLRCSRGHRMDQKIAPLAAQTLLQEHFPDISKYQVNESIDLSDYQLSNGSIALLPYSDADLELSAKVASLLGEHFDRQALANYFYTIAEDPKETRERSIIALYGLAALDEPVLQELLLISRQTELTMKEALYTTLALVELGAEPPARTHLEFILTHHGETLGHMLRIKTGEDQDDILEATALAAIIAAGLGNEEQNALQAYVMENRTKDILLYLEQLMFLQKALTRLPEQPVSFTYSLEGRKETVELGPRDNFSFHLTPEKLASLSFENLQGKVGVLVSYQKPFEAPADLGADGVKVHRSFEVEGATTTSFKSGDLVKINFSCEFGPTAPDGLYAVSDFLPAGLKPVSRPYYHGHWDPSLRYPIEVEGQRVTFAVSKNTQPFYYYARVVNPGEFKAEPAMISHIKSGRIYNVTQTVRVIIR